eukprot:1495055-Pleurochrysis_carterae.AAC.1
MQVEIEKMQEVSTSAKSTWDKFRKERDFHKMHHKRVVQEKNKLITDLKRLKSHYDNYEPMLKMMRTKYETAMKARRGTDARLTKDATPADIVHSP